MSFRMPQELIDLVDQAAASYFTTRTQLMLMAIAKEVGFGQARPVIDHDGDAHGALRASSAPPRRS